MSAEYERDGLASRLDALASRPLAEDRPVDRLVP